MGSWSQPICRTQRGVQILRRTKIAVWHKTNWQCVLNALAPGLLPPPGLGLIHEAHEFGIAHGNERKGSNLRQRIHFRHWTGHAKVMKYQPHGSGFQTDTIACGPVGLRRGCRPPPTTLPSAGSQAGGVQKREFGRLPQDFWGCFGIPKRTIPVWFGLKHVFHFIWFQLVQLEIREFLVVLWSRNILSSRKLKWWAVKRSQMGKDLKKNKIN